MSDRTPTFGSKPYHFVEGKLYDRHGKEVNPGECVIFKVTDADLYDTLNWYAQGFEVGSEQREAINILSDEVSCWQQEHPDRVKAAD